MTIKSYRFILFLIMLSCGLFYSSLTTASNTNHKTDAGKPLLKSKNFFIPPPIPLLNTSDFREYVRKFHTFPSPYGYEPYRDKNEKPISFLVNELNTKNAYIPATFYCNSRASCPSSIVFGDHLIIFGYDNKESITLTFRMRNSPLQPNPMIGFYFPNNPKLYKGPGIYRLDSIKKGNPVVTILFSQATLKFLTDQFNGHSIGFAAASKNQSNPTPIELPLSDGKESLDVGTTLYVIGLGQASGVEFTQMVSQTTGETYSQQVQTGFTIGFNFESDTTVGGGVVPTSQSVKFGINTTLSSLISNGLSIENQTTVTRSYTISPGINDTYYWAIYQLGYSYRMNAPKLEQVLNRAQSIWDDLITFKIANNELTKDEKHIGNVLPPQTSGMPSDITVGVAVPVKSNLKDGVHTQVLSPDKQMAAAK